MIIIDINYVMFVRFCLLDVDFKHIKWYTDTDKESENMLKKERLVRITQMVNQKGIISINEIMEQLEISDMTARRDLDELEKSGKLLRVHGGAQSLSFSMDHERSHLEKSSVQIEEKTRIAHKAASLIQEGETIFLGPGTTIQLLAEQLCGRNIRVVTNSLAVFNILSGHTPTDVMLTGGEYRSNTNTFVGPITNMVLSKLRYTKAFIGCNGIFNSGITTYSLEEGESQGIPLDNAKNRYLLVDSTKFNRSDFYIFYDLFNFDAVITDNEIDPDVLKHYKEYTTIVTV